MLVKRAAPRPYLPREPETFRLLVEGIQDFAIFMLDGRSSRQPGIPGLSASRVPGGGIVGSISPLLPSRSSSGGKPARLLALAARDGRVEDEGWRIRKDGSRFWRLDHHGLRIPRGGDRVPKVTAT